MMLKDQEGREECRDICSDPCPGFKILPETSEVWAALELPEMAHVGLIALEAQAGWKSH